jgi:hypothetical protein
MIVEEAFTHRRRHQNLCNTANVLIIKNIVTMNSTSKILITAIGAAAAGAVIGILLAPEKGSDIRQKIQSAANNWADQLVDLFGIMDYAESWYKLTILRGTKKATRAAAFLLTIMFVVFLGLFVLFFAGLALGIWLGNRLNDPSAGYIIVSGLFLVIMLTLIVLRNYLVFPFFRDAIIRKLYDNDHE